MTNIRTWLSERDRRRRLEKAMDELEEEYSLIFVTFENSPASKEYYARRDDIQVGIEYLVVG